jgi:hypothetical protein
MFIDDENRYLLALSPVHGSQSNIRAALGDAVLARDSPPAPGNAKLFNTVVK